MDGLTEQALNEILVDLTLVGAALNVSHQSAQVAVLLIKHPILTLDQIKEAGINHVSITMNRVRASFRAHNPTINIHNSYGKGYYIAPEDRNRLLAMIVKFAKPVAA